MTTRASKVATRARFSAKIELSVGVVKWWIVDTADHIEYASGLMNHRRIEKRRITAVGIGDDRAIVDQSRGARTLERMMGVQDGIGSLLFCYTDPESEKKRVAAVQFDFGSSECMELVNSVTEEFADRFVGVGATGAIKKKMGVSRKRELIVFR